MSSPHPLTETFEAVVNSSFAFTPAKESNSPLLGRILAVWIFLFRILSPFQWIKAIYRVFLYGKTKQVDPVDALLQESYYLLVIFTGGFWASSLWPDKTPNSIVIFVISLMVIHETLWSSLFYTIFRRMFEPDKSTSEARRFLLNVAECFIAIIWIGLARAQFMSNAPANFVSVLQLGVGSGVYGLLDFVFGGIFYIQLSLCLAQGLRTYVSTPLKTA